MKRIIIFILACVLFSADESEAGKCLAGKGNSKATVLEKCGEPYRSFLYSSNMKVHYMGGKVEGEIQEVWVYLRRGKDLHVYFKRGKVNRITSKYY